MWNFIWENRSHTTHWDFVEKLPMKKRSHHKSTSFKYHDLYKNIMYSPPKKQYVMMLEGGMILFYSTKAADILSLFDVTCHVIL